MRDTYRNPLLLENKPSVDAAFLSARSCRASSSASILSLKACCCAATPAPPSARFAWSLALLFKIVIIAEAMLTAHYSTLGLSTKSKRTFQASALDTQAFDTR